MILMMVLVSGGVFGQESTEEENALNGCVKDTSVDFDCLRANPGAWETLDDPKILEKIIANCGTNPSCLSAIKWGQLNEQVLSGLTSDVLKDPKILASLSKEGKLELLDVNQLEKALEAITGGPVTIAEGGIKAGDLDFKDDPPRLIKPGPPENIYPLQAGSSVKVDKDGNVIIKGVDTIKVGEKTINVGNENKVECSAAGECTVTINNPTVICEDRQCPTMSNGEVKYDENGNMAAVNGKFVPPSPFYKKIDIGGRSVWIPPEGGEVDVSLENCFSGGGYDIGCRLSINRATEGVEFFNYASDGTILGKLTAGKGGISEGGIGINGAYVEVKKGEGEYTDNTRCLPGSNPCIAPTFTGQFDARYYYGKLANAITIGPGSDVTWGDVGVGHRRRPWSDGGQETEVYFTDARPEGSELFCNPKEGTGCAQFWQNGVRAYAAGDHGLNVVGGPEDDPSRITAVVDPGSALGVEIQPSNDGRTRVLPEVSCWNKGNCAGSGIKIEDSAGHNYMVKFDEEGKVDIRDSWRKNMPPKASLVLLRAFDDIDDMEKAGSGDKGNLANQLLIIRGDDANDIPGGYLYARKCTPDDEDCPPEGYLVDTRKSNLRNGICDDPTGNFDVKDSGINRCQREFSTILAETTAPCEGSRIFKVDCNEGTYDDATAVTAPVTTSVESEAETTAGPTAQQNYRQDMENWRNCFRSYGTMENCGGIDLQKTITACGDKCSGDCKHGSGNFDCRRQAFQYYISTLPPEQKTDFLNTLKDKNSKAHEVFTNPDAKFGDYSGTFSAITAAARERDAETESSAQITRDDENTYSLNTRVGTSSTSHGTYTQLINDLGLEGDKRPDTLEIVREDGIEKLTAKLCGDTYRLDCPSGQVVYAIPGDTITTPKDSQVLTTTVTPPSISSQTTTASSGSPSTAATPTTTGGAGTVVLEAYTDPKPETKRLTKYGKITTNYNLANPTEPSVTQTFTKVVPPTERPMQALAAQRIAQQKFLESRYGTSSGTLPIGYGFNTIWNEDGTEVTVTITGTQ